MEIYICNTFDEPLLSIATIAKNNSYKFFILIFMNHKKGVFFSFRFLC